jgi:transcriptional regulator with XRE-family HTH domain
MLTPTLQAMPSFADNLKRLMKERGVSARVLSQATGIPASTISEWSGGREPKLSEPAVRLSRFFGVTLEYLVTGQDSAETVINDVIHQLEDGFTTIHQGVYRVRVEKLKDQKKSKGTI